MVKINAQFLKTKSTKRFTGLLDPGTGGNVLFIVEDQCGRWMPPFYIPENKNVRDYESIEEMLRDYKDRGYEFDRYMFVHDHDQENSIQNNAIEIPMKLVREVTK